MRIARDTWLVFRRYLMLTLQNPAWVVIGFVQPLIYLFLFAPLLSAVTMVRGFPPGGPYNVFVPGLVIQLGLFSASFVGITLIAELRNGVVERLRVTPVSRVAMLLGRSLRDILSLLLGSLVLIALSVPFGLHIRPAGLLVVLCLQALIGILMATLSYALALWLKREDTFASVLVTGTLPLLLLSGVLLPLSFAPPWLRAVAAANPLAYAVDAARAAFNGQMGDPVVFQGVAILAVLAVAGVATAARAFGRAVA
jgi:ABC-2 type transport system permease protein